MRWKKMAFGSRLAVGAVWLSACGTDAANGGGPGAPDASGGGAMATGAAGSSTSSTATTVTTGTSGGSGGAGDVDAGNTGGTGGAVGIDGGNVCPTLTMEYAAALVEAKRCNPKAATQCQLMATPTLSCGCPVHVQDATTLMEIAGRWSAAGCKRSFCPAIACPPRAVGECAAHDGGAVGTCFESPILGAN